MVSEVQQHLPLVKDILLQEAPLKALDTKIVGGGGLGVRNQLFLNMSFT